MDDSLMTDWTRVRSTPNRPLLGITILLVEDSRYCSEALRLLSIRSGARLRRADSLKAARKHLRIYCPDVILVDIGLPDGSGTEIIAEISAAKGHSPAILATSGAASDQERDAAMKAGASYFLEKPILDLASFQQTVLAILPVDMKPKEFTPRLAGSTVEPDAQALKDDLDHIDQLLEDCFAQKDDGLLIYAAQFFKSLGRDANSKRILMASENIRALACQRPFSYSKVTQELQNIRNVVNSRLRRAAQHF